MALDPRINLMAQPVQTMGPVDQMNAMLALQGGLQKNRLIDLQMKKAQIDLESAPALARLNELVKLAEMQKNMRIEQDAAAKAAALREAQNLMQTGGYQPTPEFPNQPQVMLNEQAALEEARRQQAAGQPVRIAVPNQGKLQALLMQANPQQATAELLKQMNPAAQRGVVVPAGGAYIPPGQTAPSFRADFAPRAEPAPVVRPVPNPNSPTGFSYEDMRRPGAPLAVAPSPTGTVRNAAKEAQAMKGFESANNLINELILSVDKDPSTVGATGFVNRIIEGVAGQTPGLRETAGTSASDFATKLSLLQSTIYRDLVGAGQLSPADYKHINEIIRGKGFLDSPQATKNALEDVRSFLKGKLPATPQTGSTPKISTDEEYRALPSGSIFIAPDGTTRTKP